MRNKMSKEDFFEAKNITFTFFDGKKEQILRQYDDYASLPKHLHDELENESNLITFNGKKWYVVDIDKKFPSHGRGIEIRIRLGKIPFEILR